MLNFFRKEFYKPIENSFEYVTFLSNQWEEFKRRDTYLTYRTKYQYIIPLTKHLTDPHFLVHAFILDSEHKQMIQERKRLIEKLQKEIEEFNKVFIARRLNAYKSLLDGTDDNISTSLDEEQRRAVIIDDQHNLVIAGAGSGKTSVLIQRIAYLIRRKDRVTKERILALALNKDAVLEMKTRLRDTFKIPNVEIRTFHSFGLSLLTENSEKIPDVKEPSALINSLFSDLLNTNSVLQKYFIEYLKNYTQIEQKENEFKTKQEHIVFMRNHRYITLAGEEVKSIAEKDIANFFFQHNIRYEYESLVTWAETQRPYHPDFYLPDFDIYIEHWGINRKNEVPFWFTKSSNEYLLQRDWKIDTFRKYRKTLVQTWDFEKSEGELLSKLKERLLRTDNKIIFRELSLGQVVKKVKEIHGDRIREINMLISTVITHAKSNFIRPDDLKYKLQVGEFKEKSKLFGEIALIVFQKYELYLQRNNFIDYNDMINKAIEKIRSNPLIYTDRYDHILIDEFQDISNQRLELIKCFVSRKTNTKLFCVGDDWQSIYKFSGSEVSFFVEFEKFFEQPQTTNLKTNYRSTKTLVDVSTQLISYNKNQRTKDIFAKDQKTRKIVFIKISASISEKQFNQIQNKHIIGKINDLLNYGINPEEIMVLSRFKKPLDLLKTAFDETGNKKFYKIRLLTVHRSKGTEAKFVFIINMTFGLFGFPSGVEDDSVLEIIKPQPKKSDNFEEERRLCYVALTRSKEFLCIYTHENSESIFLEEINEYLEKPTIIATLNVF